MDPITNESGQAPAEGDRMESLAAKEKWDHQKFLIKVMLSGYGLTHEKKRTLLMEVMQELDLIRSKVIEEVRR